MTKVIDFQSVVNEWLSGTVFAAFGFSGSFRLRFESAENENVDKPHVLYLDIKSMVYVGDLKKWKIFVHSLPMNARRGEEDEPALAYRLMLMIGSEIKRADIARDGTLTIDTSDNESITIGGKDEVWDESWILREPEDVAGKHAKFILCDSQGELVSG